VNPVLSALPALVDALCAPGASTPALAASLGDAVDPSGWGEQLTVRTPQLAGVRQAIVVCDPPLGRPALVWLYLSAGVPRREVIAALGPGLRRLAEDGQRETLHEVLHDRCTVVARGDEESVDELVLRRDD